MRFIPGGCSSLNRAGMKKPWEVFERALNAGKLLDSTARNLCRALEHPSSPIDLASIVELVEAEEWTELNDRFYTSLAFGTGGIRGRTIGRIVTQAERGTPNELGRPEFPCVGTNAMNYDGIRRASQGLLDYVKQWCARPRIPG